MPGIDGMRSKSLAPAYMHLVCHTQTIKLTNPVSNEQYEQWCHRAWQEDEKHDPGPDESIAIVHRLRPACHSSRNPSVSSTS